MQLLYIGRQRSNDTGSYSKDIYGFRCGVGIRENKYRLSDNVHERLVDGRDTVAITQ